MRALLVIALAGLSLPAWWRDSNSHAASRRGAAAYEAQQYAASADAYGDAQAIAPSASNAFNLGTSQIAAGQRERGSATLAEAMKDPALRADALFNRGNSALAAKAFDHAVRDYIDALRAQPNHLAAKRNLEIALARREATRRPDPSGDRDQQGQSQQQQQPSPTEGKRPDEGDLDLDALLRSVQQQEQEELRRMKGKVSDARVGW